MVANQAKLGSCQCLFSCRATKPSSWETLGPPGDKTGATRAVGLTPVLPARALLTQIHLAKKSAPGQMPRDGICWATSQCLLQADQSPQFSQFLTLMSADSSGLLSAAPAEVGKQCFLQIIYRAGCYLCATSLAAVGGRTAFRHHQLRGGSVMDLPVHVPSQTAALFGPCECKTKQNGKKKIEFHFRVPSLASCIVFFL